MLPATIRRNRRYKSWGAKWGHCLVLGQETSKQRLKHTRQVRCSQRKWWAGKSVVDRMVYAKMWRNFKMTGEILKRGRAIDELERWTGARWNSRV